MGTMGKIKEFFGFEEEEDAIPVQSAIKPPTGKPFKSTSLVVSSRQVAAQSEIRVEEPRIYEDSLNIATSLRENKPIIVNLKHLDSESGKRLIDFICGTAYAINGHMMKVSDNLFLFTPAHIVIGHSNKESAVKESEAEPSMIPSL